MAGAEGFEPPKEVLETSGLPLAYAPTATNDSILLNFLVRLVLAAIRAELAQFDPLGGGLLILGLRIVAVLALTALEGNDFTHFVSLALPYYFNASLL
jgi:hypothetical protein